MRRSFISGSPVMENGDNSRSGLILLAISVLVFSFCLTLLYLGMRVIMGMGGFVASGGPYVIAHEAPDWVWVIPVSVFLMIGSIFVSLYAGGKAGGPNLMSLSWSGLFLSLGWNFTQFGFGIGMGGQIAVGWVICAVAFLFMGFIPLVFILRAFARSMAARRRSYAGKADISWSASILLQLAAAAAGIYAGSALFQVLS